MTPPDNGDGVWAHVIREPETHEPTLLDDEAVAVVNKALSVYGSGHFLERSWIQSGALPDRPEPALNVERLAEALAYADRTDDDASRWYSGEVTYMDYEDHAQAVLAGLSQPPDPATAHEVTSE